MIAVRLVCRIYILFALCRVPFALALQLLVCVHAVGAAAAFGGDMPVDDADGIWRERSAAAPLEQAHWCRLRA